MPNYCDNQITFGVKKEEHRHLLDTLEQEFKTKNEILNVLRPMPDEYRDETPMPDEYRGGDKWYEWRCDNWGTKWDMMDDYDITKYSHDLCVSGSSAWDPPVAALKYYHLQHPEITIDILYFEPGMSFAGHIRFEGSEEIEVAYMDDISSSGHTKEEWESDNTEFGDYFCAQMEDYWDHYGLDSDDDPIIPESSDVGGLDKE